MVEGGTRTRTGSMDDKTTTPLRHKPKPKRNLTAYNYFFRDQRHRIMDRHDRGGHHSQYNNSDKNMNMNNHNNSFQELARTVASRWRNVSEHEREYYHDLATQDKQRYLSEMCHRQHDQYDHNLINSSNSSIKMEDQHVPDEVAHAFTECAVLDLPDCLESIFDDEPTPVGSALEEFDSMMMMVAAGGGTRWVLTLFPTNQSIP